MKSELLQWQKSKLQFMESLLQQKLECCPQFQLALQKSHPLLVEATTHKFWASGLNWKDTIQSQYGKWPGNNHLGKLMQNLRNSIPENTNASKTVLIGDSNTVSLDERLGAVKYAAFTLDEAKKKTELINKDNVVLFHVGINDVEHEVAEVFFMNSEEKKHIAENICKQMSELIDSALEKEPQRVIWSKCFPHADKNVNDIVQSVNIKIHSTYVENENVSMCENSSFAFRGRYPHRKLYKDKKHLNENGVKIFASNLLYTLNN